MAGVPGGPPFGKSFVIRARLPPRRDALFAQPFAWLLNLANIGFACIDAKLAFFAAILRVLLVKALHPAKFAKATRRAQRTPMRGFLRTTFWKTFCDRARSHKRRDALFAKPFAWLLNLANIGFACSDAKLAFFAAILCVLLVKALHREVREGYAKGAIEKPRAAKGVVRFF